MSGLETEQKLNNTNDQNELLSAQRNLFAVSDKYDILAINTYMVNEIVASEAYFPIEELIELGDKYHNDAIVDAGFNKLSREAAIRLIIEKETIWKQYGKATQERLMLALGKLLQAI